MAHTSDVRRRRRGQAEDAVRAARALSLVQMGELSSVRQALEGVPLAPGNLATSGILTDPSRRPLFPRRALSEEVRIAEPAEPFVLDSVEFLVCIRKARRGAAAGPSGMTSDHLFPVLESEGDSESLAKVASMLAVGNVPDEIIEAIRLGRLTALSKPDRGVRGIVVGDILRRLVARTIAKQIAKKVEAATAPVQHALSTKAGCECVGHVTPAGWFEVIRVPRPPSVQWPKVNGKLGHECVVDGRTPLHLLVVGREESVPEQQILRFQQTPAVWKQLSPHSVPRNLLPRQRLQVR